MANTGLGEATGDSNPLTVKVVTGSTSRQFLTSTNKEKCLRKSAPIIGFGTSAITKIHLNDLRKPSFKVTDFSP